MASNVVVLHNNRRHVIKTTPSMLCRDILSQACEKIGYRNPELYGLKNGKNTVDLALPVRLANLAAGAKLEIYKVTASEASKPITLALQCSDPPLRLTGTFPPTATLMEVLLHFEQESNGNLNIFGRKNEEAVLSVLGREFGITEGSGGGGQTTLAGMGVGGNVLVRLGFRKVGMSDNTGTNTSSTSSGAHSRQNVPSPPQSMPSPSTSRSSEPRNQPIDIPPRGQIHSPPPSQSNFQPPPEVIAAPLASTEAPTQPRTHSEAPSSNPSSSPELIPTSPEPIRQEPIGPQNRKRIVYSAASASTPAAAKLDLDDSVYNMTTEQAKGYQAHLTAASKALTDRTLMTKEMRESLAAERAAKRAFTQCDIRVRFPDGTQIQGTFSAEETVGDLYSFVNEQLEENVPFSLHLLPKGELADLSLRIGSAGFAARTLVMFRWEQGGRRALREDVLMEAVNIDSVAKEMLEAATRSTNSGNSGPRDKGKGKAVESEEGSSSGSGIAKKLPKWLNKLAKK